MNGTTSSQKRFLTWAVLLPSVSSWQRNLTVAVVHSPADESSEDHPWGTEKTDGSYYLSRRLGRKAAGELRSLRFGRTETWTPSGLWFSEGLLSRCVVSSQFRGPSWVPRWAVSFQSGPQSVLNCQRQSFPHSSDHGGLSCACTEVSSVTPDMPFSGSLWDPGGPFPWAQLMGNWQCHSVHPWLSSLLISSHIPYRPIE